MDTTDLAIAYASVVFVMSTISERVANFIKLYFQDKVIYIPVIPHRKRGKWVYCLKARLRILAEQQVTEAAEKEREYRILVINMIVGILCAAFININIFELNYADPEGSHFNLGWQLDKLDGGIFILAAFYLFLFLWSVSLILFSKLEENERTVRWRFVSAPFFTWLAVTVVFFISAFKEGGWTVNCCKMLIHVDGGKILIHFAGYLTMGVFLSLGSKFWHDLLDILFSFKRTREKLSDPKLLTDFNSADQLIKYTEISQYNIAEQLYDRYRPQIWGINGVVSCGLVTYFNERIKLYQKRIEVEFTNNEAQDRLLKLKAEGEVQINYNTFYLKDFIEIKHTTDLIALPDTGIDSPPVCYARNKANAVTKGSFGVKKSGDSYIAYSCLHVLASDKDFSQFLRDENASLSADSLEVEFYIDGITLSGTINPDSVLFGNKGGGYYGADYCECIIDEVIYNAYAGFIRPYHLEDFPEGKMRMFGATSKLLDMNDPLSNMVSSKVNYGGGFYKEMELYKIDPGNANVNPGDSGSAVYFRERGSSKLCIGMIVSKSSNNAYMFKLWTLEIPDSCKTA